MKSMNRDVAATEQEMMMRRGLGMMSGKFSMVGRLALVAVFALVVAGAFAPANAAVTTYYPDTADSDLGCAGARVATAGTLLDLTSSPANCANADDARIPINNTTLTTVVYVKPTVFASATAVTTQAGSYMTMRDRTAGTAINVTAELREYTSGGTLVQVLASKPIATPLTNTDTEYTNFDGLTGTVAAGNTWGLALVAQTNDNTTWDTNGIDQYPYTALSSTAFVVDESVACSDTNGSAVTLTAPTNGATVSGSTSITTTLNNAATVEYSIDGGAWTSDLTLWNSLVTHPASASAPVAGVTVDVRAIEDECGGYVTDSITVTVDNTCTESTPSSIIWNGTSTAAGDFSGASFATLTDVNTMEYQVTQGSAPGPDFNQLDADFGNGNHVLLSSVTTNWAPTAGASWCVQQGTTPSNGPGPSAGNPDPYLYHEASNSSTDVCQNGFALGDTTQIESNLLDAGTYALTFDFDYNFTLNGSTDSCLHLDVWDGAWNNSVTDAGSGQSDPNDGNSPAIFCGDNADTWSPASVDLDALGYNTGNIRLRLRVVTGNSGTSWHYDYALDNLHVYGPERASETTVIPWTTDPIAASGVLTDGNSYNLYARGLDNECGVAYYGDSVAQIVSPGTSQSFTWSACSPGPAPTITGGSFSGNPVDICAAVTAGTNTVTNYTVTDPSGPVPDDNFNDNLLDTKWVKTDFGPDAGTVNETGGQLVVEGGGADIWNAADEFTYVAQAGISGDFTIQVKVLSQENTNAWAKAGLMVREQLTTGSKDAYMVTTPGNGARWQYRDTTNAAALNPSTNLGGSSTAPVWLRITRTGDSFTGEFSTDGTNWTVSGTNTIVMADPVYIGLANTSHLAGTLSTTVFDDFVTTGLVPPPLYTGASCNAVSTTAWTTGTKNLDITYTDNCGTTGQAASGTFTWSACTETATLTLNPITNPITGDITVTASGTASNIKVGTSPTPTNNSGWIYAPAPDDNTTVVSFYATGTGTCGTISRSQLNVATNTMAAPVVDSFVIPGTVIDTTAPFVVPVTTFTASDNLAVTGYMITTTATAPTAGAAGWTPSAPTSFTVPSQASYTLYAWAKDAAGNVSLSASASTTVSSCTESATVSLGAITNPITGSTNITAVLGGSGGSAPQVSFDGTTWQASGALYTPGTQADYPQDFYARAVGSCGGFIYDPANPTTIAVDTRTDYLESNDASAAQAGMTAITVTMSYCGDRNGTGTFRVDYKLASSGTWIVGSPQTDADNDGTYTTTLSGLIAGEIYDIRVIYDDPIDGVIAGTGTTTQTTQLDLIAWADNPMLHNSNRFPGTIKHSGDWGTDTGAKGPIVCATCHGKETGNVKRIKATISFPDGSTMPGGGTSAVVSLLTVEDGSSDFGDDSNAPRSSSNRVCEVCHTYDASQTVGVKQHAANQSVAAGHYDNSDCIKCHQHSSGFGTWSATTC